MGRTGVGEQTTRAAGKPESRGASLGPPSRRPYLFVSLLWCVAAFAIKPFYAYVDFGVFYAIAIEKILGGTPLEIYSFVARPPASNLAIPLSHPPIWFFYLSPCYALGQAFGIGDFQRQLGPSYGQAWMLVCSLPLDILLCRTVLRLAEGSERIGEAKRWYLFLCLLLSPLLWLSSVRFGHNESAMVLMVLLAVAAGERGRPTMSGLFWGLALGIKMTAVVSALVYFGWGLGRERRRATVMCAVTAVSVFLLPLLPYILFRREQVTYALVGFERLRPIGGYVLWKILPELVPIAIYSNVLILAFSAALGLLLARRPGTSFLASGGAWALVIGQVFLLLFGKALYVWYGLAASCFLFLAVVRERRSNGTVPVAPLLASLLLWIVQGGAWVGGDIDRAIQLRSAMWVILLLGIGGTAVGGLFRESVGGVQQAPPARAAGAW